MFIANIREFILVGAMPTPSITPKTFHCATANLHSSPTDMQIFRMHHTYPQRGITSSMFCVEDTRTPQIFSPHEITPWTRVILNLPPPLSHQTDVEFIKVF
jgi:hypothetical protein